MINKFLFHLEIIKISIIVFAIYIYIYIYINKNEITNNENISMCYKSLINF